MKKTNQSRKRVYLLSVCLSLLLFGCKQNSNNSLSLNNPKMSPAIFNNEKDSILIVSVEANDHEKKIGTIIFSFPDIPPSPKVKLNNSGKDGDAIANDEIWSAKIPLPSKNNRPEGKFRVLLKAFGYDNQPILIKTNKNIESELSIETEVVFVR
jgi:hypothetical protein